MFELQERDRNTASFAWTLLVILLIGAGIGGWFLVGNLRQSEKHLTEANEALKAERTRAEVARSGQERCTQQLTTANTDLGTCNTNLEVAQARVNEFESRKRR